MNLLHTLLSDLMTSRLLYVIPAPRHRNDDHAPRDARTLTTLCVTLVLMTSFCGCNATHVYLHLLETQPPLTHDDPWPSLTDAIRPSPSDRLPVKDIVENPDQSLDPSLKDLDPNILRRKLGHHFDPQFVSIEKPSDLNDTFLYDFRHGRPSEPRPRYLQFLRAFRRADGRRVRLRGGRKQRRRLQKLMWSFTYCPVRLSWKDLGVRFWPRWLREGSCWSGRSCSMPPGMTCQSAASANRTLLRWYCRYRRPKGSLQGSRGKGRGRRQCRWIPFLYPVITKCSCSCAHGVSDN